MQTPTARPTPATSATMVPESASEPAALPTSNPGPFSGSVTVVLKDLQFVVPTGTQTMEVTAGTAVIFRNDDFHSHTVTDGVQGIPSETPLFDVKLVPGASDTFTFDALGTYTITCKPHPGMNMTVEVIEP